MGAEVLDPSGKLTREAIMGKLRKNLDVQIGAGSSPLPPDFRENGLHLGACGANTLDGVGNGFL